MGLLFCPPSAQLVILKQNCPNMNSFQFSLLFMASMVLSLSNSLITPVISGLNVYLPLIGAASTAGLGTVLAALGALKLGAAAVFFASQQGASDDETGYGAPEAVDTYGAPQVDEYGAPAKYRQRRSTQMNEADSILSLVQSLDKSHCAKQLVCQIHAKNQDARTQEESLILSLFGKHPGVAASKLPMVDFEIAAKIGATTKSGIVCQETYSTCPYTASQIITLFKSL